jgi:hypothetical protein
MNGYYLMVQPMTYAEQYEAAIRYAASRPEKVTAEKPQPDALTQRLDAIEQQAVSVQNKLNKPPPGLRPEYADPAINVTLAPRGSKAVEVASSLTPGVNVELANGSEAQLPTPITRRPVTLKSKPYYKPAGSKLDDGYLRQLWDARMKLVGPSHVESWDDHVKGIESERRTKRGQSKGVNTKRSTTEGDTEGGA